VALLEIRKYPDKVLKQKAAPVTSVDAELLRLVDNMIETMYAAPGVGLAAPQVGVSKRIAVIDISTKGERMPLLVLINPVFLRKEGVIEFEEGCLSLPEYTARVERAEKVTVRFHDRTGKEVEMEAEGLLAVALQHEIDHLDGYLIIDKVSPIKREFFKKKFAKAQRAGK
jgi:peptide deformylase